MKANHIEAMKLALEALEEAWYHVGTFQPTEKAIDLYDEARTALREALAEQPAQQQKEGFASPGGGYVPAIQRPMPPDWKLVPRKATPEMLKAMDECAQEGYDERLYAGMASSVYMAAWDASPVMGTLPEQPAQQEPVAWMWRCKPYCNWPEWSVSLQRPADSGCDGNKRTEGYEDIPLYNAPQPQRQPQKEPVVWMYVNKSTHETKFQKQMRGFVDHSLWSEVPLYGEPLANHWRTIGEPLANHELQCVCGAVWLGDEMVHLPYKHPPAQRTWVDLTDEQIDQGLLRSDYVFKTAEAWRAGVVFAMTRLKEKNT